MNNQLLLTKTQADFCADMLRTAILNGCTWLNFEIKLEVKKSTKPMHITFKWNDVPDTIYIESDNVETTCEQYGLKQFVKMYDLMFVRPKKSEVNATAKRNRYYERTMAKVEKRIAERKEQDKQTVSKSHAAVENAQLKKALQHKADGTPLFSFEKKLIADAKKAEKDKDKEIIAKGNAAVKKVQVKNAKRREANGEPLTATQKKLLADLRKKKKAGPAKPSKNAIPKEVKKYAAIIRKEKKAQGKSDLAQISDAVLGFN